MLGYDVKNLSVFLKTFLCMCLQNCGFQQLCGVSIRVRPLVFHRAADEDDLSLGHILRIYTQGHEFIQMIRTGAWSEHAAVHAVPVQTLIEEGPVAELDFLQIVFPVIRMNLIAAEELRKLFKTGLGHFNNTSA